MKSERIPKKQISFSSLLTIRRRQAFWWGKLFYCAGVGLYPGIDLTWNSIGLESGRKAPRYTD
jgi:hypothetical protein